MPRTSKASYDRNRELQRDRNKRSNPERKRRKDDNPEYVAALESRPFIAWDGEGYRAFVSSANGEQDIQHRYMLFGCSTGEYTEGIDLRTQEILELLLYVRSKYPDAFNVGFSFEYDVNMILRDLEPRYLVMLRTTTKVTWRGYRIKHVPHKYFSVSKDDTTITIYDVFGFFHQSYLGSLGKFNIGTPEQLERIGAGKDNRSNFTWSQREDVRRYWAEEISLFPPLMDKLRESCYDAGFFITQWHGPGALARYALQKYHVYDWQSRDENVPREVRIARRLAYAGGRFQAWKCGPYDSDVYTADINSAYAFACSKLPRLDNGHWEKRDCGSIRNHRDIAEFALYHIRFDAREMEQEARTKGIPFPLFHRDKKHNLTWPPFVDNWYWSPEAKLVAGSKYAEFVEAWEYVSDGTYPFDFVEGAYSRRLQLQHDGNYAEKAYKWFLASIYGQFAQRVGWDRNRRKPPHSHCLEWAGYITSYCRSYVYLAAVDVAQRGGLVSIDTDGVTSIVPFRSHKLPNGIGDALGQWKLEHFSGMLYWQNGIYWFRNMDREWEKPKSRGIPRGSISFSQANNCLANNMVGRMVEQKTAVRVHRNRFIGYHQAIQHQWYNWRRWKEESIEIQFGGSGKGRHVSKLCAYCRGVSPAYMHARMHGVIHFWPNTMVSEPHELPWLKPPGTPVENVGTDVNWQDVDPEIFQ